MTDEQIRKNANDYVDAHCGDGIEYAKFKAFIAGAHSRDKEIEDLKFRLKDSQNIISLLQYRIDELCHPWISVEERLPEEGQTCFFANFNKRRCGCGKFYTDDGIGARWERTEGNSTGVYFLNAATHWMQIPELKEGE